MSDGALEHGDLLRLHVVLLRQFVGLRRLLIEQLREREIGRDHLGGVRVFAPDAFLEIDGAEEAALVLEHGADAGVVGEAGADDGAIDQPRAFVFVDVL